EGVVTGRGLEGEGAVATGAGGGDRGALPVEQRDVALAPAAGRVVDRAGQRDGGGFGAGGRGEAGHERREGQRRSHQGGPAHRDALQHCTPTAGRGSGEPAVSAHIGTRGTASGVGRPGR